MNDDDDDDDDRAYEDFMDTPLDELPDHLRRLRVAHIERQRAFLAKLKAERGYQ
jgi:hypothetical protein